MRRRSENDVWLVIVGYEIRILSVLTHSPKEPTLCKNKVRDEFIPYVPHIRMLEGDLKIPKDDLNDLRISKDDLKISNIIDECKKQTKS